MCNISSTNENSFSLLAIRMRDISLEIEIQVQRSNFDLIGRLIPDKDQELSLKCDPDNNNYCLFKMKNIREIQKLNIK